MKGCDVPGFALGLDQVVELWTAPRGGWTGVNWAELGCAGVNWAQLGWAWLGWHKLGSAGLG